MSFEYVISQLKELRQSLIRELKGDQNKIDKKVEVEKAIQALELLKQHNFRSLKSVQTLPHLDGHGWYEYMLMIDNESGDPKDWVPLVDEEGNHKSISPGDIVLSGKEI